MQDLFSLFEENDIKVTSKKIKTVKPKASELLKRVNWIFTHKEKGVIDELFALKDNSTVSIKRKISENIWQVVEKDDIERLKVWQENESDRQCWLNLELSIDKINRNINYESEKNILTVSEALKTIKAIVSDKEYIIEGEISEPRIYNNMIYFGLKDSYEMRIDCRVLSFLIERIDFPINEGIAVRIWGKFHINKQARLLFEVKKIILTGEGELLRNLQILEKKLAQEGLFDADRKRSIPKIPKKILLLASPNSAAINDFEKVLHARRPDIDIYLQPIKTQGVGAEYDILSQLEQSNGLCLEYGIDVIVITRGGGSKDDLFVFNSEKVTRAIHALNRPTIVAIGHERDFSLAEKVADLRASTPSNAAELASLSTQEIFNNIYFNLTNIEQSYRSRLNSCYYFIISYTKNIVNHGQIQIQEIRSIMDQVDKTLINALQDLKFYLYDLKTNIYLQTKDSIEQTRKEVNQKEHFIKTNLHNQIQECRNTTNTYRNFFSSNNPKYILSQGYCVVKNQTVFTSQKELIKALDQNKGILEVDLEFYDGNVSGELKANIAN
jgi:exodeoxyribonuclease VII large subunit